MIMSTAASSTPIRILAEAFPGPQGQWHFAIDPGPASERIEVLDDEPGAPLIILELLAAVRALEAIEGSAEVRLFTPSVYLLRGLEDPRSRFEWHGFAGQANEDRRLSGAAEHPWPTWAKALWRRLDRAASIHRISVRHWDWSRTDRLEETRGGSRPAHAPSRGGADDRNRRAGGVLWPLRLLGGSWIRLAG